MTAAREFVPNQQVQHSGDVPLMCLQQLIVGHAGVPCRRDHVLDQGLRTLTHQFKPILGHSLESRIAVGNAHGHHLALERSKWGAHGCAGTGPFGERPLVVTMMMMMMINAHNLSMDCFPIFYLHKAFPLYWCGVFRCKSCVSCVWFEIMRPLSLYVFGNKNARFGIRLKTDVRCSEIENWRALKVNALNWWVVIQVLLHCR